MSHSAARPVALVTGASRGIGRAIALELARQGYSLGVNYCHNGQAAEEVVAAVEQRGALAVALQADVGLAADRERLVDELLARFGRCDLLVNNAGITSPGRRDLLEATEENWDTVFATNLKGPFFLSQRCAREMIAAIAAGKQPRGTIVNISSLSTYAVSTNRGDYCLAKAAIPMLTELFAARLAEHNIRVYEICPGIIASDMTAPVQAKYDALIAGGLMPIRRWGQPEDVARAVAAVAAETFAFSTGMRIDVDGGFRIRTL
jgi:NAD(P)-dependent dehydrogenase (short-subunit alcohol dehydrogenase family)